MKIFENSMTKIYLADCLDALNDIQDNSVDLIFADPPYKYFLRKLKSAIGKQKKSISNGVINGLAYA